jgi:RNAse (barnase) inhibitor barstar
MNKKQIIIDGNNFLNLIGFYNEIDNVLTKDLSWETGHNLNALNDLLWGGFGVHDYEEPIVIIWNDTEKSRKVLGYSETIDYYKKVLSGCHPTNINSVKKLLNDAKQEKGETLFDIIVGIIKSHEHIELILR